jgi:6-pyruvoyltetrahydropterin/6-carboxytetrahydropterin synthase
MPNWKISTEFHFAAAHMIRDYDGPCGRMHGHNYLVRVEAKSDRLHRSQYCPNAVMVADYRTLKWAKKDVTQGGLDHCVLNEVMPPEYETTAEMIAQFIYDKTRAMLPEGILLTIAVSESPNAWAYYGDEV